MTNCDHVVDDGLEEELITNEGKVYGIHSGYSFNGRVYYEDKKFHEEVWRFGDVVETLTADSLRELMLDVCDKYGYE